jgi:SAM-dependent methyltransferase
MHHTSSRPAAPPAVPDDRAFRSFQFCHWPLDLLAERVRAAPELFTPRARRTRLPIRAIRYWWVHCAILQEVRRQARPLVVADVGCSHGLLRTFTGPIDSTSWIGLDRAIDDARLRQVGYERSVECDFDQPIPMPDACVDIAIQLHVIEHLPRPEFAMSELARIVRPGGVLLLGSPVLPALLSNLRDRRHRSLLARDPERIGRHINAMSVSRWRRLATDNGLRIELESGAFLARWSGNPLENHPWWLRLNMAWGAAVPSLGGEIYLAMRKPR